MKPNTHMLVKKQHKAAFPAPHDGQASHNIAFTQ